MPPAPEPTGLTSEEAARRLASEGANVLAEDRPHRVKELLAQPMLWLLAGATALYMVLGDWMEGVALLAGLMVVAFISWVQQRRTERAVAALRDLSSPRAQVLRDGQVIGLPARELVRGDVIKVAEGDRVPADATLLGASLVSVDESLLTGESVPVVRGQGEALSSGTLLVSGRGLATVTATGARSQLGRIGGQLAALRADRTPLQREIDRLVRKVLVVAGLVLLAVVLLRVAAGAGWLAAALAGITLAMSLLPEELPLVLMVFLGLGSRRVAAAGMLTRRMTAVETLGAIQVLCTDKTGTLTRNQMTIRRLVTASEAMDLVELPSTLPEATHALVEYGILASPRDPFDPMEKAFHALGGSALVNTEHLHAEWAAVREFPLRPELLAVTHVWRPAGGTDVVVASKGAPEAIFELCHLGPEAMARWRGEVQRLAVRGLRVLAVAASAPRPTVPDDPRQVEFRLLGLVGLEDPLRPDVPAAVAACQQAGVQVLMITGDHPQTARAIASQAGLAGQRVIVGAELETMDDATLRAALAEAVAVARATPAHKLRIVQVLQGAGRVVAMTGDGVNDAPALKAADVGIAMGTRGTDVAREAAAMVLVGDDFGSIAQAIRTGRTIYDNLQKAVHYLVAVHLPIAGLALAAGVLGWGLVLAPVHVLFIELVIDPACSVIFEAEAESPTVMARPPRPIDARLLDRRGLITAALQGLFALVGLIALVAAFRAGGASEGVQRALGFSALVAGNLAILTASRGTFRARKNLAAPWLLISALLALVVCLWVPGPRDLFQFATAAPWEVVLALAAGALPVGLVELMARLGRRAIPT